MSGLWGFVNTVQLINYSSMFTLYYPQVVLGLFSFLGVTDLQSQYLTDIYLMQFDTSVIKNKDSWDYRFQNQNIGSTNILMNWGDSFLILNVKPNLIFIFYKQINLIIIKPTFKSFVCLIFSRIKICLKHYLI